VCFPKGQGDLGILDLDILNIALLSKWLWKLFNEVGPWQQMVTRKYLDITTIGQLSAKPGDSHFWKDPMEVKKLFRFISDRGWDRV
jgi:hypothetical protein